MDVNGHFDSMSLYLAETRNGLHKAGRTAMSSLTSQIELEGHGWLDGYMESLLSAPSSSRTPYVNLLKTPSRTQTVKKTRQAEAAATVRAEKLMSVNKQMAGSPMSKSNSNRMPLSPLGARNLNTTLQPLGSPSVSKKTSSKSVKVMVDPPASKSSRSTNASKSAVNRKGVPAKRISEEDDQAEIDLVSTKSNDAAASSTGPAKSQTPEKSSGPSRSVRSGQNRAKESDEMDIDEAQKDVAPNGDPLIAATSIPKDDNLTTAAAANSTGTGNDELVPLNDTAEPASPPVKAPTRQVRSSWLSKALGTGTVPVTANARGSEGSRPSVAHPAPTQHAINNNNRQTQQHVPFDFSTMPTRKSLAQPGMTTAGAKRKSDVAEMDHKDGEDEGDGAREKMQKKEAVLDTRVPITDPANGILKPALDRHKSHEIFPRPASAAATAAQAPAPSAPAMYPAVPAGQPDVDASSSARTKSDIHTVARRLDEMREKQQAKEALALASKQKAAALSLSSGSGSAPSAPSQPSSTGVGSGTGFLRGWSSTLGRSLGLGTASTPASAKDAEEAAKKLAKELADEETRRREEEEMQKKAEEELRVIMEGSNATPGKEKLTDGQTDIHVNVKSPEQVEEEDEMEVAEAVGMDLDEIETPSKVVKHGSMHEQKVIEVDTAESSDQQTQSTTPPLPVPTATAQTKQKFASAAPPPMQSPSRPRASPPPTRIPILSPTRPRPHALSTTPQGSPRKAFALGNGSAASATRPASPHAPVPPLIHDRAEKVYPSPGKIPTVKPGLADRVKMFDEGLALAGKSTASAPAIKPAHINKDKINAKETEQEVDMEGDATASEEDDESEAGDLTREEEQDELDDDEEEEEEVVVQPVRVKPIVAKSIPDSTAPSSRPPTASSTHRTDSALGMTASTSTSTLSSATLHANKALGLKPSIGPVKSLQPKKASAMGASERRAQMAEDRKKAAAEKKAEDDRKAKEAEVRKRELDAQQQERRRREIEARKRAAMREKEEKEEREREEREREKIRMEKLALAEQKRKAQAAALAKSQREQQQQQLAAQQHPQTQIQAQAQAQAQAQKQRIVSTTSTNGLGSSMIKMKEPVKLTKPSAPLLSSSTTAQGPMQKIGPTSFRTAPATAPAAAPETPAHQISGHGPTRPQNATSTIALVGATTTVAQQVKSSQPQPIRPSGMNANNAYPPPPAATASSSNLSSQANTVLHQQRAMLVAQLDAKAAQIAAEDIVLPDIASEYSDSDDSDQGSPAFKRPSWAESPALREALKRQAAMDPDALFGPVQALSMEEVFKVPKGKFRHRTSSANWSKDGLTKGEEEEYARRMGFLSAGLGMGQGQGQGQGQGLERGLGGPGSR